MILYVNARRNDMQDQAIIKYESQLPNKTDKILNNIGSYLHKVLNSRNGESPLSTRYEPENIDNRIRDGFYFYMPDEDIINSTCFETNVDLYLAIRECYPELNPSVLSLKKDTSLHTGVLFTHDDHTYFADAVFGQIGKCNISENNIYLERNLYSDKLEEELIKYSQIKLVSHKTL